MKIIKNFTYIAQTERTARGINAHVPAVNHLTIRIDEIERNKEYWGGYKYYGYVYELCEKCVIGENCIELKSSDGSGYACMYFIKGKINSMVVVDNMYYKFNISRE